MLTIGTLLLDRYRIDDVIGQGGMGSVYLATHIHLNRPVAVKQLYARSDNHTLDAAALRQFKHEALLLQNLKHPRLPAVYDYMEIDGCPYLMMEYVRGVCLIDLLERGEKQTEGTVLRWALALCEVLEYLHTRVPPIIFRDMKPGNIMLDQNGQIKLIDFGIAKLFDPSSETKTFAKGSGSPGYSAPEQYHGTTDVRSDMYSLGATLHALLTHARPPQSVEMAAGVATLPVLHEVRPDVSREFSDIVHWCMQLRAEDRPRTAQEVRLALEALGTGPPDAQPSPGGIGFARTDVKRNSIESTQPLASPTTHRTSPADVGPAATGQLRKLPQLMTPKTGKVKGETSLDPGSTLKIPLRDLPLPPPPGPRTPPSPPKANSTPWVAGGVVATAVVAGLLFHSFVAAPLPPPSSPIPTHSAAIASPPPSETAPPHLQGLYSDVRPADDGTEFQYDNARQRLLRMHDYTLKLSIGDVRYAYACERPNRVRLEALSGPTRGTVYVYLPQKTDRILVKKGPKSSLIKTSDPSVAGLPVSNSLLDSVFADVQKAQVKKSGPEIVDQRPCWVLTFSNGIAWDIDKDVSLIVRVKNGSRTEIFSDVAANTAPHIGP